MHLYDQREPNYLLDYCCVRDLTDKVKYMKTLLLFYSESHILRLFSIFSRNKTHFLLIISMTTLLLLLSSFITASRSAMQNSIVGSPLVDCMNDKVMFTFSTKNIFHGRLYVKGRFSEERCRKTFFDNEELGGNFSMPLGICGMQRLKTARPTGIFFTVTVVLSFHPIFLTDSDKAFNIRCFYQAETRLVSAIMGVSNIATTDVIADALVPDCKYSVRAGGVDGPEVRFSKIGDKVFHVWHCEPTANYKVLIHNCFVSDTGGKSKIAIIDERGCSIDPVVIGDVTYSPHRAMGVAESFVFKYADESMIYFMCTARICSSDDQICTNAPKTCPTTVEKHEGKRSTNADAYWQLKHSKDDDISSGALVAANLFRAARNDMDLMSKNILVDDVGENLTPHGDTKDIFSKKKVRVCLSPGWFCALVTLLCGFGMILVIISVYKFFWWIQLWDDNSFGTIIGVHPDRLGLRQPAIKFGSKDLTNILKSSKY